MGDIKKEYINQIPQLCNLYNMSEKDSFDDLKSYISGRKISQNNINFISHKIFGYSDLLIDEPFRESVYNRKNYKLNKDFYETLTNLVIDDSIEFDEIKGCSFSKEDSKDEINDIRVLLKNGEIDGYEKLINVLSREKSKKYFIYNENVLKNVIEDNILLTNMKSEDFCKQIKDSKVDITSLAQFLTKNSINEVFCDDYYLEEVKDILSAGDEYDFFIQDNDNAILKVSMEGIDRLSIKYDLIATTVPNQISVQKNRSRIK